MSRQNSDHHDLRRHTGLPARLVVLSTVVLGLLLTHVSVGHAFSIGLRVTSDLVSATPNPPFDPILTFNETVSCIPGHACGSASSPYAVVGTSLPSIRAGFQYDYFSHSGSPSSLLTVEFLAIGRDGMLARLRAFQRADAGWVEAVSCGPQPGSCVAAIGSTGPLPPQDPNLSYISLQEFASRSVTGEGLNIGSGFLPFFLPVGRDTAIGASVQLTAGFSFNPELCLDFPEHCHPQTGAVFTLIASPPPGAQFLEPVPEPTTLLLMGTTAAALGVARWRQRRRKQAAGAA